MNSRIGLLIFIVIVGIFFSVPLMCLLIVIMTLTEYTDNEDLKSRYFVYFLLALLPALINTTKPTQNSDLAYYYWLYEYAATKSIGEYWMMIPKEPLYHMYTYIVRYLTFGEFKLFVIVTSLMMYLPVMFAFDIIVRKNQMDSRIAIYAAVLLLMFPQYFFYTMQIVRQVLAGSIAFYCIVKSIYYDKKLAILGVLSSGFIHSSAFIFSIYYVFLRTKRLNLKTKMVLLGICGTLFYAILGIISSFGAEDSTIVYAALRGLANDDTVINVGFLPRFMALLTVPFGLRQAIKLRDDNFNTFISVIWIIVGYILLKWNDPLYVLRFLEYTYMFIPISVSLFVAVYNRARLLPLLAICMVLYFCIGLSLTEFSYIPIEEILVRGVIYYFI